MASTPSTQFTVPSSGGAYIEQILERSEALIATGIWAGLTSNRLRTWWKNFSTPEEKYFGACVLDSLVFRSRDQTIALMTQLFQRSLPDLSRKALPTLGFQDNWMEALSGVADPEIRLVVVIKPHDNPTKSGPILARMYRRHLKIHPDWIIWPWRMNDPANSNVKSFVFIDDFVGTGEQFCEFTEHFKIDGLFGSRYCIYAPLVAHIEGIKEISMKYPKLNLCTVEELDYTYGLFKPESPCFDDGTNSPAIAKRGCPALR